MDKPSSALQQTLMRSLMFCPRIPSFLHFSIAILLFRIFKVTRHATGHMVLMRSHSRPLSASLQPRPSCFIQIRHSAASHQMILCVFCSSRRMPAPSSHATLMRSAYHHYMSFHSEGTSHFAQLRHRLVVAGRIACPLLL